MNTRQLFHSTKLCPWLFSSGILENWDSELLGQVQQAVHYTRVSVSRVKLYLFCQFSDTGLHSLSINFYNHICASIQALIYPNRIK